MESNEAKDGVTFTVSILEMTYQDKAGYRKGKRYGKSLEKAEQRALVIRIEC